MAWRVDTLISKTGISGGGRMVNEDHAGAAGELAWMLDGAGLGRQPRFPKFSTDAAWLVHAVSDWLAAHATSSLSMPALLGALEKHIASAFGLPDETDPAGGPSACLTVVRCAGSSLELAWIADTVAFIPRRSGRLDVVTDDRVAPFEELAFTAMRGLPRFGSDLPERARDQIRLNRTQVNQPSGYAVVCPSRPWAHLVRHATLDFDATRPIVLMSDGVSRLFDTFRFMTAEALYARCAEGDGPTLLETLRAIEQQDPDAQIFTRFKIHDDATLLVARAIPE